MNFEEAKELRRIHCVSYTTVKFLKDQYGNVEKINSKVLVDVYLDAMKMERSKYLNQEQLVTVFNNRLTKLKIDGKMQSLRKRLILDHDLVLRNFRHVGYRVETKKIGAEDGVIETVKRFAKMNRLNSSIISLYGNPKINFNLMDKEYHEILISLDVTCKSLSKEFLKFHNNYKSKYSKKASEIFDEQSQEINQPPHLVEEDLSYKVFGQQDFNDRL